MSRLMQIGKSFARYIAKAVGAILLILIAIVTLSSISPIYNFREAKPFAGPDIYNPYHNIDSVHCWKRANFHTHTRVEGIMNECRYWPEDVLRAYEGLGYDIVTFSNHNELTAHPRSEELQVDVYEHGYNLLKFHKLTFGAEEELRFDHILPILASQKQFQIELLSKDADIIQLNHPLRTPTLSKGQLERLSGYKLIELDSGKSTENDYWDAALSAGRYSFGLANDDLHYPDRSSKIAVRCNFLSTPSARYEDILKVLNEGGFYSMRIPDYGNGDWNIKREKNSKVPQIEDISLTESLISIRFSESASLIKVIGQGHTTLASSNDCDTLTYAMKGSDPYARIVAHFPGGEVIYTNPFARYDATLQESPFDLTPPEKNILLTILFNLLLLVIFLADGYAFYKYIIKR